MFILAGCYLSRTIDQATASDVNNRSFTFTNGAVFNAALANVSTALAFSNNAQQLHAVLWQFDGDRHQHVWLLYPHSH